MSQDKEGLILVTGASGFVALHIIDLLLREGHRVRGTVRSLKNETKLKPLKDLCPDARHPLQLVEADLTQDAGWDEALQGCEYCFHVASPFPNAPPKRDADLIVPALEGTNRVLQACANAGTVKRIVLTSSALAVHGEFTHEEGRVYNEDDWTDLSQDVETYARSKTMAEKAAWDFVQSLPQERKIELVTINPGVIFGPPISGTAGNTSLEFTKRLMDGSFPMVPRVYISICDVRDVALAHLRAMILPEAANHRHIINSDHMWLSDMTKVLKKEFGSYGYGISTCTAPYLAVYLFSFIDKSAKLVYPRHGKAITYSNSRMKEVLKVEPRNAKETLIETAHALIESGALKKTESYKARK